MRVIGPAFQSRQPTSVPVPEAYVSEGERSNGQSEKDNFNVWNAPRQHTRRPSPSKYGWLNGDLPFARHLHELAREYDLLLNEVAHLTRELHARTAKTGRIEINGHDEHTGCGSSSSWKQNLDPRTMDVDEDFAPRFDESPPAPLLCAAPVKPMVAAEQCPNISLSKDVDTGPAMSLRANGYASSEDTQGTSEPAQDGDWERQVSKQTDTEEMAARPTQVGALHQVWLQMDEASTHTLSGSIDEHRVFAGVVSRYVSGDAITTKHWIQNLVLHPNSVKRLLWDVFSVAILIFDICWIPFQVFEPPSSRTSFTLEWISTMFWSSDIVCSFLTGFHENSLVEMRAKMIARRYMTSWFPFDLVVVSVDWLHRIAHSVGDMSGFSMVRIGKSLRFLRILRSVQFLRIMKLNQVLGEMMASVKSEYLRTSLDIVAEMACLVVFSHFTACLWYLIGTSITSEESWADFHLTDPRLEYRYATSLHWAVTQFTLTSIEIFPCNAYERCFSIMVLFLALLFFSSFVSSITTAMAHLSRIGQDAKKMKVHLRQYFYGNQITVELANRIMCFLGEKHYAKRMMTHEKDLDVIKLLPEQLLQQLHVEVFMKQIEPHPFFWHIKIHDGVAAMEICHIALKEHPVDARDVIFTDGKLAPTTLFINIGEVGYVHRNGRETLIGQTWLTEAAIWLKWFYKGTAVAITSCEIAVLDTMRFRNIIAARPEATLQSSRQYAELFAAKLAKLGDKATDLPMAFDEIQEMVQISWERSLGLGEIEPRRKGIDSCISRSLARGLTLDGRQRSVTPMIDFMPKLMKKKIAELSADSP